jgi:hypothetical protein
MNTKLQKFVAAAALGLALCAYNHTAWAGEVHSLQVSVSPSGASGSMAGARYSKDNRQYIGCSFSNTNGPFVLCTATDKTGKSFSCASTDARWLTAVKTIIDFSYLSFSSSAGSASCSSLQLENSSRFLN